MLCTKCKECYRSHSIILAACFAGISIVLPSCINVQYLLIIYHEPIDVLVACSTRELARDLRLSFVFKL